MSSPATTPPVFPQVLVVHGPAGGVGKTLIAIHLAYLYAAKGLSTVLVDLSQYGAHVPWLGVRRPGGGVAGLLAALDQGDLTDERTRSSILLGPGTAGRLHLVPSSGPTRMDRAPATQVEALLRHLAAQARVVVVDTGPELTERVLGGLLAATRILLTLSPQAVGGWQALELLTLLRSLHVPKERFGLVFSRVRPGEPYGLEEYQQVLDLPVLGNIPEAGDLRAAAARGGPPAVRGNGRGLVAIRRLAHNLVPIFNPKELRQPWPWNR